MTASLATLHSDDQIDGKEEPSLHDETLSRLPRHSSAFSEDKSSFPQLGSGEMHLIWY